MSNGFYKVVAAGVAALAVPLFSGPAGSASFTSTFTPSITIANSCVIVFTRRLNFQRHGILDANIDRRRNMRIRCSAGVNYEVGLDAGTTPGGTTSVRKMVRSGATIDYMIYQDAARTINWGNNPGVDTVSRVGTGNNQNIRVYGRVPPQTTPAPGRYTDVITVTVTF